jgi:hypothetical protein
MSEFVYEQAISQYDSLDYAAKALLSKMASERLVAKGLKDFEPMHIRQELYQMYKEHKGSLKDCYENFILSFFEQNPDVLQKAQKTQEELNFKN